MPARSKAQSTVSLLLALITVSFPRSITVILYSTAFSSAFLPEDVRFFWNHNIDEKAIARSIIPIDKPGGMELSIGDDSVRMLANPNRKRTDANDLCLAVEDGVVSAMSFMFGVAEERWEDEDTDYPKRFILRIDPLIEVSAVNYPAYKSTSIHAREDAATEIDRSALERMRKERRAKAESMAKYVMPQNIKNIIKQYGGKV